MERPWFSITASDYLQRNATPEQRNSGADVADILIDWKLGGIPQLPDVPNTVLKEVRRCISPEHWPEVQALIEDLNLELVSIQQIKAIHDENSDH